MQKEEYQEIGEPAPKAEDGGEKEDQPNTEEDKLVNIEEEDKDKQMPDFIAAEAKKADVGFYVLQVIASLGAGAFAAYSGYHHSEAECGHPVAFWLQIIGVTIVSIGLLWWIALFALKYIRKSKLRGYTSKFFSGLLMVIGIFFIVWWVLGHVWVFQTSRADCDGSLYLTGLWFIIGVYIYTVVMICLQCWVAMCLVCCAVFRPSFGHREEQQQQVQNEDPTTQQPLVKDEEETQDGQEKPDQVQD